ncbi:MAG: hypothetical protein CSA64_05195, partial [Arachnia propionica]
MNRTARLAISCLAVAVASLSLAACGAEVEANPADSGATVAPTSEAPSSESTTDVQDGDSSQEPDETVSIGADGIKVPGATVGPDGIEAGGASVGPGGIKVPGATVGPDGIKVSGVEIGIEGVTLAQNGLAVKVPGSADKRFCKDGSVQIAKGNQEIYLAGNCTDVMVSGSNNTIYVDSANVVS